MANGMIYCLTSRTSGKSYVGQTWNLGKRYGLNGQGACMLLKKAVEKYGWDDFDLVVLQENICLQEELNQEEIFWIAYLQAQIPSGYNLREGGSNGRHCQATRKKMSEAHMGHEVKEETRRKIGAAHRGRKKSAESNRKRSRSLQGRKLSKETKQKLRCSRLGMKASIEARKNMSIAQRQRAVAGHSKETKRKLSQMQKGKLDRCSNCGVAGHKKPTCPDRKN